MRNERLLAFVLIGLGVFSLLTRGGGADWLWIALLGGVFLFGYVSRQSYGFLIAGSVLVGIAVGTLLGSQGGMLLSLAAGFYAIDRVERRPNRWPLYTAGILALLGLLSALGSLGILTSLGFALLLIAGGLYLLYREREGRSSPAPYAPTSPPASPSPLTETAPPAPETPTVNPNTARPGMMPPITPPSDVGTSESTAPEQFPNNDVDKDTNKDVSAPPDGGSNDALNTSLNNDAQARLERLELWRKETAASAGTPAYIIFSNDTLFRIASSNPQTLDDLAKVRGVGPVKLTRYGDAVLALLQGSTPDTSANSS